MNWLAGQWMKRVGFRPVSIDQNVYGLDLAIRITGRDIAEMKDVRSLKRLIFTRIKKALEVKE